MISRGFCTTGHMPILSRGRALLGTTYQHSIVDHTYHTVAGYQYPTTGSLCMPRESTQKKSRIWFLLKACGLSTTVNSNQNLKNDDFSETVSAARIMQSLLKSHELFIYEQKHTIWAKQICPNYGYQLHYRQS